VKILCTQESLEQKKGESKMKKPTKEEIGELIILLIAIAVGVLVFTTTFVIAREIFKVLF
jgi:hypothetical protein